MRRRLCSGESRDGDAEGRAGDVVKADLRAEGDRSGVAAVLSADAELERITRLPSALDRKLDQLTNPAYID